MRRLSDTTDKTQAQHCWQVHKLLKARSSLTTAATALVRSANWQAGWRAGSDSCLAAISLAFTQIRLRW